MAVKTLTINDRLIIARESETILEAARDANIHISTLCHLEGVSDIGACRLCLVEIGDSHKLQLTEGNHVCSVCVANGNCELQDLAVEMGMEHVSLAYQFPQRTVDLSHDRFDIDHNRCILCTRCVKVCDEIEGAHTWDMAGRGRDSHVITDLNQFWGTA